MLRSWLAGLLILLRGQLPTAICRCITLCLMHLPLLLTQLILVCWFGLAREQLLKFTAMFADPVRQAVDHSRNARLGSSFKLSSPLFSARDQFFSVCNFLLKVRVGGHN